MKDDTRAIVDVTFDLLGRPFPSTDAARTISLPDPEDRSEGEGRPGSESRPESESDG